MVAPPQIPARREMITCFVHMAKKMAIRGGRIAKAP
jgi:hypothetical protein